jgi:hypothetical protein
LKSHLTWINTDATTRGVLYVVIKSLYRAYLNNMQLLIGRRNFSMGNLQVKYLTIRSNSVVL